MRELSNYIDQDVGQRLMDACDRFRVDVGSKFARLDERKQNLEQ